MDGLLVIDKPQGPTSHDVVARVRRLLGERRIGHTGTLDPMATGVLPLLLGKATRLARFMPPDRKRYDAVIKLGASTDSYDALGATIGEAYEGPWPTPDAVDVALEPFRGPFLQQPPAFSAKKIDGERSYTRARRQAKQLQGSTVPGFQGSEVPALPAPAPVVAHSLTVVGVRDQIVEIAIECSSGFYVRSLAHDLGERLGTHGHLISLRRTETCGVTLAEALALETALSDRDEATRAVIPMEALLPHLGTVRLTQEGARKARQGQNISPPDAASGFDPLPVGDGPYRLMDDDGALLGIAERASTPGLLHPVVILM